MDPKKTEEILCSLCVLYVYHMERIKWRNATPMGVLVYYSPPNLLVVIAIYGLTKA